MAKKYQAEKEIIFSVSDYIKILNQGLEAFKAKIIGEVSEVSFGPTGHVYFTLKDEEDGSIIKCVIWKFRYDIYGVELKEGIKIIAAGHPEIYAPWGRLSFKAEVIEHAGEGTLKKEYEKLKEKLAQEGLFEEERKRPIPKYSQKIGVITSKQGAVLADFLNNLGRFGFKVKMIDSRVEGQAAITDLLNSIKTLKKKDIEALVIMRGGGSLESMLAFNNELLVREITNFPVPVIAAIGHHKDVPLAALAADYSVSTPSMAAVTLGESWKKGMLLLEKNQRNIFYSYENTLENANLIINDSADVVREIKDFIFDKYKELKVAFNLSLQTFKNTLQNKENHLKNSWKKFIFEFDSSLSIVKQQLKHSEKIIYLRNPETQLELGYSIVRRGDKGGLIRSIKDTKIGEDIDIQVKDGEITSQVKKIKKKT